MGQLVLIAGSFQVLMLALVVRRLMARGGGLPRAPVGKRNLARNQEIGARLVASGLISKAQLQAALEHQEAQARRGRLMWLGESLVDLGYVQAGQIQDALKPKR